MNPLKSLLERIKRPRRAKTLVVSLSQKRPVRFSGLRQNLPRLSLLMATSIFFAFLMNTGLWTVHHEYKVGDIAERDIKASHDFLVEDKETTEKNRTDISKTVLSSYDYDPTANFLLEKIAEAFSKARESLANLSSSSGSEVEDTKSRIKEEFFFLLGIHPDETLFEMLWKLKFSEQVENILTMLLKDVYEIGIINFANFPANEMQKGIVLKNVITGSESVVVAFDRFLDIDEARQIIKQKIKESKVDNYTKQALLRIAPLFVQPNITYNRRQTMLRMEAAKSSIKPFYQIVKKGEIIIREGERITPIHLQKLAEESRQKRPIDLVWRLAGSSLVNVVFLLFTYYVGLSKRGRKYYSTKDLVFLSGLLILFGLLCSGIWFSLQNLIMLQPDLSLRIASYVLPVASVGLIVSIFKGISAAVTVGTVFCIFASTLSGNMLQMVFYFLTGTMLGVYNVRFAKERKNIILAAIKIASVNGAVAVGVELSLSQVSHLSLVGASAAGFFGGILSGVFTTGLLPLIEMIFGYTNNIKLIELASLDSPLIKELMLQAPGTYHHSVVVSSLSEAAASSVGANPILCKVASLYHDIGKIKMPQYFVENQGGGENKHERLAPSMSALILLSHVRDGVELAGKAKLPQEIIAIIQQHHGTSLIQYFYQKAKEQAEKRPDKAVVVNEEDFRYPGPKPQSKEAAVVMLSDSIEAASRSLEEPSPARIKGLVQKIINRCFADGQLDDCDLTLKDLHKIAKSLNTTLAGIFHQRIQYPDQETSYAKAKISKEPKKRSEEDGDSGKVSGKETWVKIQDYKDRAREGLKRLGI